MFLNFDRETSYRRETEIQDTLITKLRYTAESSILVPISLSLSAKLA